MSGTGQLGLALDAAERIGDVERALAARGTRWVIGVDEAGRGPLAGPVTVAAVLFDVSETAWVEDLTDSKQLTPARRDVLFDLVRLRVQHAIVSVGVDEIDTLNILWASMEGMRRAIERLRETSGRAEVEVLVDGNRPVPGLAGPQTCLVKGDARSLAIAAASVLAKVTRDREMQRLDALHPGYGFAGHKGYPTPSHLSALRELGPCPCHRRSFAPVAAAAR